VSDLLGLTCFGLLCAGCAWYGVVALRHLPQVWRGERTPWLPSITVFGPSVNLRSYPTFVVAATGFGAGGVLTVLAGAVGAGLLLRTGIVLMSCSSLLGFFLIVVVNALNRPRFLVPPRLRNERGWLPRRRHRA
jgi:hypothetical protein